VVTTDLDSTKTRKLNGSLTLQNVQIEKLGQVGNGDTYGAVTFLNLPKNTPISKIISTSFMNLAGPALSIDSSSNILFINNVVYKSSNNSILIRKVTNIPDGRNIVIDNNLLIGNRAVTRNRFIEYNILPSSIYVNNISALVNSETHLLIQNNVVAGETGVGIIANG
jgi:hypothetical protein